MEDHEAGDRSFNISNLDLAMLKPSARRSSKAADKPFAVDRPPIAPIKIRLKTNSIEPAREGRSLSSVLAEIIKDRSPAPAPEKVYNDFKTPLTYGSPARPSGGGRLELTDSKLSANLSTNLSAVSRLYHTSVCRQLVLEVVDAVLESRQLAGDLLDTVLDTVLQLVDRGDQETCGDQGTRPEGGDISLMIPATTVTKPTTFVNENPISSPPTSISENSAAPFPASNLQGQEPAASYPPPSSLTVDKQPGTKPAKGKVGRPRKYPRVEKKPAPVESVNFDEKSSVSPSPSRCTKLNLDPSTPLLSILDPESESLTGTDSNQPSSPKPIIVKIPKLLLSPTKPSSDQLLKVPMVKIKPIPAPNLEVVPTNKKLKIRITKRTKVNKLTIKLKGRKAAKIVKNSKLLKKKLSKTRIDRTKRREKDEKPEPAPAKVSCVTVMKMSEIVSMKPAFTPTTVKSDGPVSPFTLHSKGEPDLLDRSKLTVSTPNSLAKDKPVLTTAQPNQNKTLGKLNTIVANLKSNPLNTSLSPSLQTELRTPEKAPEPIPELDDEFASLENESSTSTRKLTVKDPKNGKKMSPKKVKVLITGIKPYKQGKDKKSNTAPVVPEKKKTPLELIMEKIPPAPILPAVPPPVPLAPQRRSSREGWLTSPPPVAVARKSRPGETVSFALPSGGFKGERRAEQVPWYLRVDELFNQFYPGAGAAGNTDQGVPAPVSTVLNLILDRVLEIISSHEKAARLESEGESRSCSAAELDTTDVTETTDTKNTTDYRVKSPSDSQRLVSSKGFQAIIDLDRYQSGEAGDCILLDEDWITPNSFLEKTGNRSKNHRRSISVEGSDLGTVLEKLRKETKSPKLSPDRSRSTEGSGELGPESMKHGAKSSELEPVNLPSRSGKNCVEDSKAEGVESGRVSKPESTESTDEKPQDVLERNRLKNTGNIPQLWCSRKYYFATV